MCEQLGHEWKEGDLCSKLGACVEVTRGCSSLLLALFVMQDSSALQLNAACVVWMPVFLVDIFTN